jgi:hypothetical protein
VCTGSAPRLRRGHCRCRRRRRRARPRAARTWRRSTTQARGSSGWQQSGRPESRCKPPRSWRSRRVSRDAQTGYGAAPSGDDNGSVRRTAVERGHVSDHAEQAHPKQTTLAAVRPDRTFQPAIRADSGDEIDPAAAVLPARPPLPPTALLLPLTPAVPAVPLPPLEPPPFAVPALVVPPLPAVPPPVPAAPCVLPPSSSELHAGKPAAKIRMKPSRLVMVRRRQQRPCR